MNFILPNTRKSLVSELADYVLMKIKKQTPKSISRIEVVDFVNFFVVNGYTTSQETLDMNSIVDEFKKESKTFNFKTDPIQINVIDIIKYNTEKEFQNLTEYNFTFYNTSRPIFPINSDFISPDMIPVFDYINFDCEINSEVYNLGSCNVITENSVLSSKSEFPYGFENEFRINLYFFERIAKHLFKICNSEKIKISYDTQQDENEEIKIGKLKINANSEWSDEMLESLVKDVFDFNFLKFKTEHIEPYDFTNEITKPFEEKTWLVLDKVEELVII
jgi:S-adenosylmethionine synthetase